MNDINPSITRPLASKTTTTPGCSCFHHTPWRRRATRFHRHFVASPSKVASHSLNRALLRAAERHRGLTTPLQPLKPPAKKKTVYVWECCQCGHSGISIRVEACPACQCTRCAYCPTTKIHTR
ncbi:hypothetical protein BKA64DRAFT_687388 [Cadophora sp. MPI-SDFR-AT-0126]|nr:hypothetical protein BKA64DRAFT_687388 [Leotiomycetes sp. MPI-SDFR-AT-0126]